MEHKTLYLGMQSAMLKEVKKIYRITDGSTLSQSKLTSRIGKTLLAADQR